MSGPADATRTDWFAEYPPPRSLPLDQEALRVLEHAYALGVKVEHAANPPVTFTTVLSALLAAEDETSRWFLAAAAALGPDATLVFQEKSLSRDEVKAACPSPGKPESVRLSSDKHLLTTSARTVLENAERWAQRVGGSDIGIRHLIAAYVLNPPPDHGSQMKRWKYQQAKWRTEFFAWIPTRYTAERWTDTSHRPAPTKVISEFERPRVKGASLAFPGDDETLAILERAAAVHACGDDTWLRLQTVLHALIETARVDENVRKEIEPVWAAVGRVDDKYQRACTEFKKGTRTDRPVTPFKQLDISPRVLNALETARELALATRRGSDGELRVDPLHLAGAIVSRRVDGDEALSELGLEPRDLRLSIVDFAVDKGDSAEIWREALGEEEIVQMGRPVELNSDEPESVVRLDKKWTSDPLQIRRDVETFAALLASKTLEPPLSIGLFGPWGSGKTTFLRRLRKAIELRAAEAKMAVGASRSTDYVSNVVHVEFNAWHFSEGPLVSSLVDTILRELNATITGEKKLSGKALRELKHASLASTQRNVEAAEVHAEAARDAVKKAEEALIASETEAAEAAVGMQAVVDRVWSATKASVGNSKTVKDSGVLEAVGKTLKDTEDLRRRLEAVRSRPARLLGDLGWPASIGFALLVMALPAAVVWAVNRVLAPGQAGQFLSAIAGFVSAIGLWARGAAGAVAKVDTAITEVADAYIEQLANDGGVVTAKGKLAAAEASAATAAAALEAARQEFARAQTEAANASLPAQMLRLVSSRLESRDYSKELTTMSLARADLEMLSRLLREQGEEHEAGAMAASGNGGSANKARAVDRVVLYIDDLDRCRPEDVVRVLQLVHMLLAFELFVVVVAVDARWVEAALTTSYPWLGDGEGTSADYAENGNGRRELKTAPVTPQDYLEKIFQIAFWLEPMTSTRAARYLGSLVPNLARESGPVRGTGSVSADGIASGATPAVVEKIEIAGIELDYMRALSAYIGSSPRRVKRLVNAYRLIKAALSDGQLKDFLTDSSAGDGSPRSGPYQIVIGLLVIATGAPTTSAHIVRELAEWDPGDKYDQVVEQFRKRGHPEWTMAAQVIETVMRTRKTKDMSELRGWARKVGRFLLNQPAADVRMNPVRGDGGVREPVQAPALTIGSAAAGAQEHVPATA